MKDVLRIFLKLGCLGFGGPLATIAMMEKETVEKRRWLTQEQFAKIYAVIKVLPGPAAVQMSIHLGKVKAGIAGGFLAGFLFIFPSFLIVLIMSYFYDQARWTINLENTFQGMQVAALVVILDSVFRMAVPYRKNGKAIIIAVASALIIFFKPTFEPLVILAFGMWGVWGSGLFSFFLLPSTWKTFAMQGVSWEGNLGNLSWVCFKAGAFVFGTGLAIVPLLEGDVVGHYHWLNHSEFLDGLAIGQVTPGPVMITATFIGFKVARFTGATLATLAIFTPAFINMLFLVPILERGILNSKSGESGMARFSQWAIPSVIGGIVGTSIRLGLLTINSSSLFVLFIVSGFIVYRWRPPVWAVIPGAGFVFYLVG